MPFFTVAKQFAQLATEPDKLAAVEWGTVMKIRKSGVQVTFAERETQRSSGTIREQNMSM